MRIEEAVKHMTSMYLDRILDSFTKDLGNFGEEEAREYIVENSEQLAKPENIERRLDMFEVDHSSRVLIYFMLETILNSTDCALETRDLVERIRNREQELIAEAESEESLKYADDENIDILRTLLEVAFEDEKISRDEYNLIERLRQKLDITRKQQRVVEAQLDGFPQVGGELHTHSDVKKALKHLQYQGILFYCNRAPDGRNVVLPQELEEGVKGMLSIELSENARELLWKNLQNSHLKKILEAQNLPTSGNKEAKTERLLSAETRPSEGLASLKSSELYEICDSLPGVVVSGTKDERIERIVSHFDNLMIREVDEEAETAEMYYRYFVELAARDRENLLANDVITKDLDINNAFEEATRYLFREKLGVELIEMEGTDHPDGCVRMPDDSLLMWDNKSKEGIYTFPNSHLRQFRRYIRDAAERVNCFLIVVPAYAEEAETNCLKLKHESGEHDSDVPIVAAEDLKWVAENWEDYGGDQFNLGVLNQTGLLDRSRLEQLMKVFL